MSNPRPVTFFVAGEPRPMARPRVTRHGSRTYIPDTGGWRAECAGMARAKAPEKPLDVPVEVEMELVFARPATHVCKDGVTLRKRAPLHVAGRRSGDIDNLAKNVLDALQHGGVIEDDAAVVRLVVLKRYEQLGGLDPDPPGAHILVAPVPKFHTKTMEHRRSWCRVLEGRIDASLNRRSRT
jgi:Holliday junction resolvase RusA-like endonuclease